MSGCHVPAMRFGDSFGGNITNFVNGQVVTVATLSRLWKGKLLFQSEVAEIFHRRIELTPLKKRG